MIQTQSIHGGMRLRVASMGRHNVMPGMEAPRRNHLLAALPDESYERLRTGLEPIRLRKGSSVRAAGVQQKYLYFITAGVISRWRMTEDGKSAEFATSGSEGVVGVSLCLGRASASSEALVLVEGFAYRIRSDRLMGELDKHEALMDLMLQYTRSLMAHTGWVAICNRCHHIQQQVCRWLLNVLDRAGTSSVEMTHDLMARMLGVRRESVSLAVKRLQDAGVIHCKRGRLILLDRRGLVAHACECYGAIRREYGHLRPGHSGV